MRGVEAPRFRPVQPLEPEAVLVTASPERLGALTAGVPPLVAARPLEHRARRDQRARRAPEHLVGLVVDVLTHALEEVELEVAARRQSPGDDEDPGLASEQSRLRRRRRLLAAHEVGLLAERGERPARGCGEIDRRLGDAASAQHVERMDHAGGADVQVLHRRRRLPAVPLVGGPERVGVVGRVDVGDDAADRVADDASSHGVSVSGSNASGR